MNCSRLMITRLANRSGSRLLLTVSASLFLFKLISSLHNEWRQNKPQESQTSFAAQNSLVFIGDSSELLNLSMEASEADAAYFRYLSHLHFTCNDSIRLGNAADGGWDVCLAGPYLLKKPCLVYSFGINYDFSFDDAVSETFGCTIRSFDPSMSKVEEHVRKTSIWFFKIGLGGNDTKTREGWTVRTLKSIVQRMNDSDKLIDYLKMDIEHSEWESLESMFNTGILSHVKQLAMEVHIYPLGATETRIFYEKWIILQRLEAIGFRRWYWHLNDRAGYKYGKLQRSCCYEMVYINTNYLRNT